MSYILPSRHYISTRKYRESHEVILKVKPALVLLLTPLIFVLGAGNYELSSGSSLVYTLTPQSLERTEADMRRIVNDIARQTGKAPHSIKIHLQGHGWRSDPERLRTHGKELATRLGKDAVILLDFPDTVTMLGQTRKASGVGLGDLSTWPNGTKA